MSGLGQQCRRVMSLWAKKK